MTKATTGPDCAETIDALFVVASPNVPTIANTEINAFEPLASGDDRARRDFCNVRGHLDGLTARYPA